ncbi:IS30 family transposase [Desulforhopalus vacuolatus]|uniref:IS30 family transposase n=1 Tax=Desulforhopalus vacuolatus TaxID=40414 RepID=UPI001963F778|nr:IS30 family transposase [Desulforhopalus vacuolatus]MBM9520036.1 IS30 family transposase [Desulforhopalus vacuolatus]
MHKCTSPCYQQITLLERYQISAFLQIGRFQTDIADTLNRSKSTISREINRNSFEGIYDPCVAHVIAMTRRKSAEKATKQNPEVLQIVQKWLRLGWSPESISSRFSVELPLQEYVCHTAVYDWIYKDRQKGGKLHTYLPRYGKRRWKGGKRKRAGGSLIPDRVDIAERPQIVNERTRIGDWEGDTVYGQNASLVERTSRFTLCGRTQTRKLTKLLFIQGRNMSIKIFGGTKEKSIIVGNANALRWTGSALSLAGIAFMVIVPSW